jgi:hypothetical protein
MSTHYGKERDERRRMIAEVKRRQLPGANLASTWGTDTLRRKLFQTDQSISAYVVLRVRPRSL